MTLIYTYICIEIRIRKYIKTLMISKLNDDFHIFNTFPNLL